MPLSDKLPSFGHIKFRKSIKICQNAYYLDIVGQCVVHVCDNFTVYLQLFNGLTLHIQLSDDCIVFFPQLSKGSKGYEQQSIVKTV